MLQQRRGRGGFPGGGPPAFRAGLALAALGFGGVLLSDSLFNGG